MLHIFNLFTLILSMRPLLARETLAAVAAGALAFGSATFQATEVRAQDRKIVTIEDADFFGSDYQTVKDVDLEGCKSACLKDEKCRAFTFNTSAGWCFLKSDFGSLQSFAGAVAGRVVEVQAPSADIVADRKADLTFLTADELEDAKTYAAGIAHRRGPRGTSIGALRQGGEEALRGWKGDVAERSFVMLLNLDPSDFDGWLGLTRALVIQDVPDWDEQRINRRNAISAGINAYLRAVNPREQALVLEQLSRALLKSDKPMPSIKAARAALALEDTPERRRRYDKLIAKYGFRILSHSVETEGTTPRVCVVLSLKLPAGEDLSPYMVVQGPGRVSIDAHGSQLCAEGLEHGARYEVTIRSGLPSLDGETLEEAVDLSVYVPDRSPSVRFLSRSYVLPSGGSPTIPVVTVNTSEVEASIYRIGNRSVADVLRDKSFLRQLSSWQADKIENELGEKVWSGVLETENRLNQDVTTAFPVIKTGLTLKPGVYAMTARSKLSRKDDWSKVATQWFLVSDLGLSALSGDNGIAANIRSLGTARALEGVTVRLLAVNNEVLGETTSDADGRAEFAAGLTRGRGGLAPGVLVAQTREGDYSFLDLRKPAFDLSDRGVEGRPAPGPLDVFAWTDRGIYKAGETVHAQALLRTAKAIAQEAFPLTFLFTRPDGVEYARYTVADSGLGGHLQDLVLSDTAQQGQWSWQVFADPKAPALAQATFLVEDYQPERVDFDLQTKAEAFSREGATPVSLTARFLYGSPASGQSLQGDVIVRPVRTHKAFPGYQFGLENEEGYPLRGGLPDGLKTDKTGRLSFNVVLPELTDTTGLYDGTVVARLVEAGGRAVERHLDLPVVQDGPRIGIKPAFDGDVDEGGPADFSVIVLGADGKRQEVPDLTWTLYQIERRFQWYKLDGRWSYEPIVTSKQVAAGALSTSASKPVDLSVPVDWGEYRLEVKGGTGLQTATSVTFNAGWYSAGETSETPDFLDVGLDKASYQPGDIAKLRLKPQMAGIAVVNVLAGGVLSSQTVEVSGSQTEVSIPVSGTWGAGAYVTASLFRPMDLAQKRMPSRAIGLAWLQVDPGARGLQVELNVPERIKPETVLDVPVKLANLKAGEKAYLTIAAVDAGILNLTGYKTPDPEGWYFGQRRLGTEIRDLYGQLIDRMAGTAGRVRSGGDAMAQRLDATPPEDEPLALFSGLVEAGPDGTASVSFDIPDFNGALRLIAVAWSKDGVGHGEKDIEVRSPVVISASAPAFLAPADTSRIAIEIDNLDGAAGSYTLDVSATRGLMVDKAGRAERLLDLEAGGKAVVRLPVAAGPTPVKGEILLALTGPDGQAVVKRIALNVRNTQPDVVRRTSFQLNAGASLELGPESFDGLLSDTVDVSLTLGGAASIDVAGLLTALDRYPYRCTEQTTSRALPLLYLGEVAEAAGLGTDKTVKEKVEAAITQVLSRQSSSGAFGLWSSNIDGGNWLSAYATDFLTQARDKGYHVPEHAFIAALDNLENRLSYSTGFEQGGEGTAYALYVLARNGRASMGDLRYYLDVKLKDFRTPLAKAQLAASLALYGEKDRAVTGFKAALSVLKREKDAEFRLDFGSKLRDIAAVTDYVVSASLDPHLKDEALGLLTSAQKVAGRRSTQDMVWLLLAANALNDKAEDARVAFNGVETPGRLAWQMAGAGLEANPALIRNKGTDPVDLLVSVSGKPSVPEPAGGVDYEIERHVYDLNGTLADPSAIAVNTRLAVVLTVRALTDQPGRLMVVDRLPAGLVIDNPRLLRSGDLGGLPFLNMVENTDHAGVFKDRFEVAIDQSRVSDRVMTFAYLARAATPGAFVHPPATVEDMYRPDRHAITETGRFKILGPVR